MDYLQYAFFRNAVIGILIISVAAAMIGTYIITRRMVSITGGITHACFGGLGLGYYLGISPVFMAAVFAVTSSMGVEWIASRYRIRETRMRYMVARHGIGYPVCLSHSGICPRT